MKRGLILLFALCTLATAFVPRERRAVNTEEYEDRLREEPTAKAPAKHTYCSPKTACQWIIYNSSSGREEQNIPNTFCVCAPDQVCEFGEDNGTINTFVFYCKERREQVEDTTSTDS